VVSYLVGEGKPHQAMYEAMEATHCGGGVPLLYADDREENILAARARGWRAYHFGTAEGCRAALQEALAARPRP
jgi:2-haloacid dehalogenase